MKIKDISKIQILILFSVTTEFRNNWVTFSKKMSTCIYDIRKDHLLPFRIIVGIISLEMRSLLSNLFPNSKKETNIHLHGILLGVIIRSHI